MRQEYWELIRTFELDNLVFIDESGVNIAMTRLHARSLKGQRAHGSRPDKRGKNVTIIGAIALRGIVGAMSFKGGNDRNAFETYVNKVLVPNLWKGACVVMDNFSSHKVVGIKEAIESVGAHLIYLSPYSPDFSPIENFWSKIKEFLRSQSTRIYSDLDKAITEAFETVSLSDIFGWFQHCGYCISSN
ncbi:MAG: IS630 family transposase [Calothrix sp. MO_167.B12]|nr:IS630 family transposase [Calothrix sp. MO_167.B12]